MMMKILMLCVEGKLGSCASQISLKVPGWLQSLTVLLPRYIISLISAKENIFEQTIHTFKCFFLTQEAEHEVVIGEEFRQRFPYIR